MRHKNWKTYLKIACSWLLIFSICFMNLETVSASEDETSVVTEQEETQDTEAFTSETDAQQTETEQTSEQFTSETETETSAETEEQIPDSIEVEKLEKEIQEASEEPESMILPFSINEFMYGTKKRERGEHLCSLLIQRIMQSGLSVIWQ